MSRPLRWVVVVGGTGIAFLAGFRLGVWDPFGWLPEKDSDRVSAAAGFGGAMAAVCALVGGWWAGGGESSLRQRARASGTSRVTQTGGGASGPVDQRARADGDSRVQQTAAGGGEQPDPDPAP
ncbi:hypothetical protein [Streptomyces sp. AP-93]|uniref:hypothetical protein n=1 Tax=Streptomyces sp. AP-93 TaxID=2929048 RepID=UPI001FAF33EE|nr:hypothetical protein [Streptomyces sp. AP-93]MCJ0874168.1 hypothetical protein [Streptomyces sp. AP-93]